jgi:hypothetical protein
MEQYATGIAECVGRISPAEQREFHSGLAAAEFKNVDGLKYRIEGVIGIISKRCFTGSDEFAAGAWFKAGRELAKVLEHISKIEGFDSPAHDLSKETIAPVRSRVKRA